MEPDKKLPSSTDRQMYQLHKKGYEDIAKALEKVADVKLNGIETVTLKGKDGYTPKKNIDYFTPEEQKSFVEIVLSKIPRPKDGVNGKDAVVDYNKLESFVKKEIAKIPRPKDGVNGKDAVVDIDSIVKKVLSKIPKQKEVVIDYDKVKSFVDSKIKDLNIEERLQLARLTNSAGPRTRLGEMHDVDLSGLQTDQYLKWNGKKWVAATVSGGGATTFLGLTDTPSAYTGQAGKFPKVNAGETGLEFVTISGGGDMLASTYDPANKAEQILTISDIDDTAYNEATWNGVTTIAPSKNAVRDEIEDLIALIAGKLQSGDNVSELVNDAGYLTDITGQNFSSLSDVTITSITSGEIPKWNGSAWINNTLAEAGISAVGHTHTASEITDFDTEVSNNTDVSANTSARHTHANQTVLDNTTASFTTAQETKLGYISITQAVDLDAIETRVNALDASVILMGTWDASVGTFPGSGTAQAGESWIVSVGGTVDGVEFTANDRIVAITDNASTTNYASNWHKLDYTDQVLSVNTQTGAVVLDADDIDDTSTTNKFVTSGDVTKLGFISITQSVDLDDIETKANSALQNIVDDTTPQLGGALDGQGNDLNNLGVAFFTEQASAESDVAGKGQIWVKTATPNELWFTDDAGTDFLVASAEAKLDWKSITIDGGGSAIATGVKDANFVIPQNATIKGYTITADTGTCTVKFLKRATGTVKAGSGDEINTSGVSLSTGTHVKSTTVTDFTATDITAFDQIGVNITAVSSATHIIVGLIIQYD